MSIRIPLIVTVILVAAMLGLSLWAWPQLPAQAAIFSAHASASDMRSALGTTLLMRPASHASLAVIGSPRSDISAAFAALARPAARR